MRFWGKTFLLAFLLITLSACQQAATETYSTAPTDPPAAAHPAPQPTTTPAPQPTTTPAPTAEPARQARVLIQSGRTVWHYWDAALDPAEGKERHAWASAGFSYADWNTATGSFGAQRGEATALAGGLIPQNGLAQYDDDGENKPAYFFAATFEITNLDAVKALTGRIAFDDAVIVYINGQPVFANNLPDEPYANNLSFGSGATNEAPTIMNFTIGDVSMLHAGRNTVCVELHQANEISRDIYFDFISLMVSNNDLAYANELDSWLTEYESTNSIALMQFLAPEIGARVFRWYSDYKQYPVLRITSGSVEDMTEYAMHETYIPETDTYAYTAEVTGLMDGYLYLCQLWDTRANRLILAESTFTADDRAGDFDFIFAGDPQFTNANLATDAETFKRSLSFAESMCEPAFLYSAGDQIDSPLDVREYYAFSSTDLFKELPVFTIEGNHDRGGPGDAYFQMPNSTEEGNYYFQYGDALFVSINTTTDRFAEHKRFLTELAEQNRHRWLIVTMHESLFGVSDYHTDDSEAELLRAEFAALFSALDVDVVLSGHDHCYARSWLMEGPAPGESAANAPGSLEKKYGQTLYICANTASGSKYYDIADGAAQYAAVYDQQNHPNITIARVSAEQLVFETYDTEDEKLIDKVTLKKSADITPFAKEIERLQTQIDYYKAHQVLYMNFIRRTQLPGGALTTRPLEESDLINPYFACYAARAMLSAGFHTEAKAYLDWHFANLNTSIILMDQRYTIYDYAVRQDAGKVKMESTKAYDSADSYAALLLSTLQDYWKATGDDAYIQRNAEKIRGVIEMLHSLFELGLFYASHLQPTAYFMDNCEVYAGLLDAQSLLSVIGGDEAAALQTRLGVLIEDIDYGLDYLLWNGEEARYEYSAVFADGDWIVSEFDGRNFYPDAVSQLMPILTGVIDVDSIRAEALYQLFSETFDWQELEHMSGGHDEFYWGLIAYTAALMGDTARLDSYLESVAAHRKENAYTLYNADAAFISMACTHMIDTYTRRIDYLERIQALS